MLGVGPTLIHIKFGRASNMEVYVYTALELNRLINQTIKHSVNLIFHRIYYYFSIIKIKSNFGIRISMNLLRFNLLLWYCEYNLRIYRHTRRTKTLSIQVQTSCLPLNELASDVIISSLFTKREAQFIGTRYVENKINRQKKCATVHVGHIKNGDLSRTAVPYFALSDWLVCGLCLPFSRPCRKN